MSRVNAPSLSKTTRVGVDQRGRLTHIGSSSAEERVVENESPVMAEESHEDLEAVRIEKLRRIEALGLDPWGSRFDGHRAIADVRALPLPTPEEGSDAPGPTVRVAGRIMLRRGQGKVARAGRLSAGRRYRPPRPLGTGRTGGAPPPARAFARILLPIPQADWSPRQHAPSSSVRVAEDASRGGARVATTSALLDLLTR